MATTSNLKYRSSGSPRTAWSSAPAAGVMSNDDIDQNFATLNINKLESGDPTLLSVTTNGSSTSVALTLTGGFTSKGTTTIDRYVDQSSGVMAPQFDIMSFMVNGTSGFDSAKKEVVLSTGPSVMGNGATIRLGMAGETSDTQLLVMSPQIRALKINTDGSNTSGYGITITNSKASGAVYIKSGETSPALQFELTTNPSNKGPTIGAWRDGALTNTTGLVIQTNRYFEANNINQYTNSVIVAPRGTYFSNGVSVGVSYGTTIRNDTSQVWLGTGGTAGGVVAGYYENDLYDGTNASNAGTYTVSMTSNAYNSREYVSGGVYKNVWKQYTNTLRAGRFVVGANGSKPFQWQLTSTSTSPGLPAADSTLSFNTAMWVEVTNDFLNKYALKVNGDIYATSGSIYASSDIIAYYTSDQTLKTNIVKIDSALSKVNSLDGVTFNWNEAAKEKFQKELDVREAGVLAQQVQAVLPEVVKTREDGTLAVKYEQMVPLLIEAIKELTSQVKDLQNQLNNK